MGEFETVVLGKWVWKPKKLICYSSVSGELGLLVLQHWKKSLILKPNGRLQKIPRIEFSIENLKPVVLGKFDLQHRRETILNAVSIYFLQIGDCDMIKDTVRIN